MNNKAKRKPSHLPVPAEFRRFNFDPRPAVRPSPPPPPPPPAEWFIRMQGGKKGGGE